MPRPPTHAVQFADVADVTRRLSAAGYLPDHQIATTVFLADRLGKPLLVEGPAGVGKTELAKAMAAASAFASSVLPVPAGPSTSSGLPSRSARNTVVAICASAR